MHRHRLSSILLPLVFYCGCAETVSHQRQVLPPTDGSSDMGFSNGAPDAISPVIDPGASGPSDGACRSAKWSLRDRTLKLHCQSTTLTVEPQISANDEWLRPDECLAHAGPTYRCVFDSLGTLSLHIDGSIITPSLASSRDQTVDGFRLIGTLDATNASGWSSNGLQSWSQTGIISIPDTISNRERVSALTALNDVEVIRSGRENSWWHTTVFADVSLVIGSTTAKYFRSWIGLNGLGPRYQIQITSGGLGDSRALANGTEIEFESWFLALTQVPNKTLEDYGRHLPRRDVSILQPAIGWNSWYQLWDGIDEQSILDNMDRFTDMSMLLNWPRVGRRIVVNDGWQRAWGEWDANEQFGSGLESLARQLNQNGYQPGIWLAPLLVKANVPVAVEEPDWFVADVSFRHLRHGEMRILDVTHPDAAAFLKATIRALVNAGFSLLKVDYLFVGAHLGRRHQPVTGLEAYNLALELIRDAAGPETTIVGVGALPIAGFEHLDSWRFGPNIAVQLIGPSWHYITGVARTLSVRWPYCFAIACDPDPIVLRQLPDNERTVGVWTNALAGGSMILSDDLRLLGNRLFESVTGDVFTYALGGMTAQPIGLPRVVPDVLSSSLSDHGEGQSRHQIPSHWTLSDGNVLVFNWNDQQHSQNGELLPARSVRLVESAAPTAGGEEED
ncbi:MAG: alpha-galactosidase [Myxococcota bacterium]|nr:alpha-galactosidase [Myxococcota bacterium]